MGFVLTDLLKRSLTVGAQEVRLIPGRRTIVVVPQGESEVRGDPQTPDSINALLQPVLTVEAKRALSAGWAEWDFDLEGRGQVRACAEVKVGLVHVSFFLDRCDVPASPGPASPGPVAIARMRAPSMVRPAVSPSLGASPSLSVSPSFPAAPALASPPPLDVQADSSPAPEQPALRTQPPLPPDKLHYENGLSGGSASEIDRLLILLVEAKGSDLHISTGATPMMRKDGEMQAIPGFDVLGAEALQRMVLPIVPPRNREEFTATHDTDFAYELPGLSRFRANLFVDLKGMGAVFRVIPSKILSVDDLQIPKEVLALCHLPKGLVLVTGPTGSGKSTTLAALIDYINRTRGDHIITIEDPVEFVHPNKRCLINQRQVGEHTDSFKKALRAALREDPDIVLLGEMRDLETIAIALETAETGHLVFGTLHTSSAPATIDRIIDQYPPTQQAQIRVMLANSLKGVIAQMLCKKIGGGRAAAFEIMFGVPAIANLIRESKIFQIPSIMQTSRKMGMALMNDSLFRLAKDGIVAPEEALAKANDKAGFLMLLQQANIAVTNPSL